jgi:hypothetical protein
MKGQQVFFFSLPQTALTPAHDGSHRPHAPFPASGDAGQIISNSRYFHRYVRRYSMFKPTRIRAVSCVVAAAIMAGALAGCGSSSGSSSESSSAQESSAEATTMVPVLTESSDSSSTEDTGTPVTNLSKIDNSKWQYNADDDVYYQLGISYCENPADASYETLAVFVPGAYMNATDNGDGTYTCTINTTATVGDSGYTAETAPIVFPVNTPGYVAQAALTEYQSFKDYTDQGFIYVHAGCRGRDAGAPAGVTDLKAAIRYLRYNDGNIAGSMDRIFTFGMSGGGAQSALLGVTGDSSLYDDYLTAIGAVQGVSDAVAGSMCWCPITSIDSADEAYEWQMGNTRTDLSDDEQQLSDDLTAAFADYINNLGLKDEDGNTLTLEATDDGRYQSGTYYEYIKSVVEDSLNEFLADTTFPYDADAATSNGGPGGAGGPGDGGAPDGAAPDGNGAPDGAAPGADAAGGADDATDNSAADNSKETDSAAETSKNDDSAAASSTDSAKSSSVDTAKDASTDKSTASDAKGTDSGTSENDTSKDASADGNVDYTAIDDINRGNVSTVPGVTISGTYQTAQDYIDALNANGTWVKYDADTNRATITSLADFSAAVKLASKSLGAFDELDDGQGENTLFGYGDGKGAHFDSIMASILKKEGSSYADDYASDLEKTDSEGHDAQYRLNMYSPLYYLMENSDGYQTSNVAKFFRINTGIFQSDTAVTTEANLALALKNYGCDVDFNAVWGLKHTMAEPAGGDSTTNFIQWVNDCVAQMN